jgi:hypothetical protein
VCGGKEGRGRLADEKVSTLFQHTLQRLEADGALCLRGADAVVPVCVPLCMRVCV